MKWDETYKYVYYVHYIMIIFICTLYYYFVLLFLQQRFQYIAKRVYYAPFVVYYIYMHSYLYKAKEKAHNNLFSYINNNYNIYNKSFFSLFGEAQKFH